MDRHRIEQFVGKNDSGHTAWRHLLPGTEPADVRPERVQRLSLPLLSPGRWFQNPVFQLVANLCLPRSEPGQNIGGQLAIVGARFENLNAPRRSPLHFIFGALVLAVAQPLRKLEGKQFPEQSADTDVGIEIAAAAGPVRQSFIISKLWTIEAKLHEPRERNNAARLNLAANNFT